MDDKSTDVKSTWFVATTPMGKYICRVLNTRSFVDFAQNDGNPIACNEVYELIEPVNVEPGGAPDQIMVRKDALATPYGSTSCPTKVHISLLGAHVLYFEDMSNVDQLFHKALLDGPRHLAKAWEEQRQKRFTTVQLATEHDLRAAGLISPRK